MDPECFLRPEVSLSDESAAAARFTNTAQDRQNCRVSAADFDYLKVIGTGSFGEVLLAKYKENNRYYAIKVLKKRIILKKEAEGNVMCERNVLVKTLNHPFLVRLHFSFQTKERLCLVLDYASGGEVDLKPENILLNSEGHVVLTDFGLCKEGIVGRATTKTFCGTPEYLAPEVLQQQEYDRTVDWWGLGAVLHEMLYGLPPFYSADRIKMLGNIIYQPLVLEAGVSKTGKDFLKRLLNKDRSKRLGAKHDMDEIKRHAFFSSIHWDDLVAKKIPPPFVPTVTGPDDLTNINPAFTRLPVPEFTDVCEEAGLTFPDFSYISATSY
ncbi:Serine/threonine-protein kinase Sgk1-A [Bagarius yarrelli]|uniref:Serine/threonine-protein kinase Sgk1-A n=1 Tax=Bagarius yarrelli TaxID=175774 RepID=A0A556TM43_BAGYA|nr:Serine/threonine-protein kinase Sgk1-A [Bagarius yarrelli]